MSFEAIDAQFHRAVDIVQSLPKGGPVQTSYEEKLSLYSLYKQAMEGDVSGPRPGLLDMLSRAKWDSWNKQKGVSKSEAKRLYVAAFLKILKKHSDLPQVQQHIEVLEAYAGGSRRPARRRAASSSSSTSSYHSSQASPSHASPKYVSYPAPDPSLPAPDVAPDIVPPSALTPSHRSLLNLSSSVPLQATTPMIGERPGAKAHSLADDRGLPDSVYSQRRGPYPAALGFVTEQPRASGSRPLSPQFHAPPELVQTSSTPGMPHRAGSASTFAPASTIPQTLQQIQTSLTALHERMSTLERTQAVILRREDKGRAWFWGSGEADELDDLEEEVDRARWPATTVATRTRRTRTGLPIRVVWFLRSAIRRAIMDAGVGIFIGLVGVIVLHGGWRRARVILTALMTRGRRFIREA